MSETPVKPYQDPAIIQRLVSGARTVAMVGLSANPLRPSHFVGFYLLRHGFRVIPVNPRESEVLGQRSVETLGQIDVPVDIVDVFREPSVVPQIATEAAAIGAKALWLQFGVVHEAGAEQARAAGLDVVMDLCLKIEHARYLGRMHWLGFDTGVVSARRRPAS
jgi:predicted CoA-binding protein